MPILIRSAAEIRAALQNLDQSLLSFGKEHKVPYRTLMRVLHGGAPSAGTWEKLDRAIDKYQGALRKKGK